MNADKRFRREPFFAQKLTLRHFVTLRRFLAFCAVAGPLALILLGGRSATTGQEAPGRSPGSRVDPLSKTRTLTVPVQTAVRRESYEVDRTYTGMVVASRTSQLGFERSARVIELRVREGDRVAEGDVLAILDCRQMETEQRRLKAQRDQAAAVLAERKAGPRAETIAAARAEVRDWAAQLELQRRHFARTTELVRQNAVSREQNDQAELGVQSLQAKLDAAQKRLDELEAGTRLEQIDAQEAIVKQLDASLADIAIEIEDSQLLAPFDGTISQRHLDEGTVVAPAEPIYEIVESAGLEAEIGLPPRVFDGLTVGQSVEIVVGGRTWPARLDRASAVVELRTRTRKAIFQLDATASGVVVPGEVARVTLGESNSADGFWVPTRALIRSTRGLWAIYVAEPVDPSAADLASANEGSSLVARRDVEVLHTSADRTFVRGLLRSGEQIIVSGTQRIVPGQRVQAVSDAHSPVSP